MLYPELLQILCIFLPRDQTTAMNPACEAETLILSLSSASLKLFLLVSTEEQT